MLVGVLLGERYVENASQILDVERRVPVRDLGISERTCRAVVGVEDIDPVKAEVCGVEMIGETVESDGKTFVDRPRVGAAVRDFGGRPGSIPRLAAGNRTVLGGEQEEVTPELRAVAVKDGAGWTSLGPAGRCRDEHRNRNFRPVAADRKSVM